MRKPIVLLLLCLMANAVSAQIERQMALGASYNRVELSYRQTIAPHNIWGETFAGLCNDDVDNKLNDFTFGIKVGYPFLQFRKSEFDVAAVLGGYIPNNKLYDAATLLAGVHLGYSYSIGKRRRHWVCAKVGYNYGKRSYSQTYSNSAIMVSTTDVFRVSPLYLSLGYAFKINSSEKNHYENADN